MVNTLQVETATFGNIEVTSEQVVIFPHGLPGFEERTKYALIEAGEGIPFSYLQSLEDGDLAFLLTDPFVFFPQYAFDLPESIKEELGIQKSDDVLLAVMVSLKQEMSEATANLLAPIVIHVNKCIGKQVILNDSRYTTKHRLMPAGKEE